MAALANVGANIVWQQVKIQLAGASEQAQRAFLELKRYLATQGKNPKLQLLTFVDADITTAGGKQLGTGTPTVYGVYIRKSGTSGTGTATASYVKINDDATDDTTAANQRIVLPLLSAAEEVVYVNMSKAPKAWSNGVVVGADTSVNGTTDSTAGDAGPGFVIVG